MTALAKRAVACAGFRWMDGMDHGEDRVAAPNLAHPATLGCFEHGLLPSVGYNDAHLDPGVGKDGETLWFVVYRPDPVSFPGRWLSAVEDGSPTKAEALVAALEVAPQLVTT